MCNTHFHSCLQLFLMHPPVCHLQNKISSVHDIFKETTKKMPTRWITVKKECFSTLSLRTRSSSKLGILHSLLNTFNITVQSTCRKILQPTCQRGYLCLGLLLSFCPACECKSKRNIFTSTQLWSEPSCKILQIFPPTNHPPSNPHFQMLT